MKKIGVIHTTKATVDSLTELIKSKIEDAEVYNILDDSILRDMAGEKNTGMVRWRWLEYAKILEKLGMDIILSACSTVGGFAEEADHELRVPVLRIDEAMAEKAVAQGEKIGVFATLNSTLNPTVSLIKRKAEKAGRTVSVRAVLVDGAYDALMSQNKELHDSKIAEALKGCQGEVDVIVLAQASMASAVSASLDLDQNQILTSPVLGIDRLKECLCNA
ncbi:aspartate/glutamate racemase family protein [uncultured Robinsoniella sp.]|uniref:aspartate/glutamate racemase family protein n=1 Tax=uncultured Robinsoniella sp. TaxID=904190 RepID=UPI00374EA335